MSTPKKILVIGAGPCGLGACFRLEEIRRQAQGSKPTAEGVQIGQFDDWELIDQSTTPGGLSASIVDENGFTWDKGGHVIFSHYAYFSRLLDHLIPAEEWNTLEREAWVWMRERFVPYPFQQNLHRLPKEDIVKCIDGLLENDAKKAAFPKPKNFEDWLQQSFGTGLCDVFMVPYNKKVWAYHPSKMNVEWMGERVATVDTKRVIANVIYGKDEVGWGPNATFRFPLHGGTGAIWTKLFNTLPTKNVSLGKKVTEIDVQKKTITYNGNDVQPYEAIISTMPMDYVCRIIKGTKFTKEELEDKAKQFRYSSSHIIGFGLDGQPPEHLKTKCWLYFPEDDSPFYRATVFSNYSPNHVPKPNEQWSLMCEVSESPDKPVDQENILKIAEQGLLNTKLITKDTKILSRFHIRLEYGYPTPFVGRDQLMAPLHAEFEKYGVYSRGRFGTWKYEVSNQDHSLMLGVEVADKIVFGMDEPTHKWPGVVNANRDNIGRVPFFGNMTQNKQ